MQFSLMIARFPYGGYAGTQAEHPDVTDWVAKTYYEAKTDPRINRVVRFKAADTPIPMTRNRCIKEALAQGVDAVIMIDADMSPDRKWPGAKPFFKSTIDFWEKHSFAPMIVGAPYCGPIPGGMPFVFRWVNDADPAMTPEGNYRLEMFPRDVAAERGGFETVAAIGTGLIFISLKAVEGLKGPWFYYQYVDEEETQKSTTEDVAFTRDIALLQEHPVYVNWDAWAGHWKCTLIDKPVPIASKYVAEKMRKAVLSKFDHEEKVVMVEDNQHLFQELAEGSDAKILRSGVRINNFFDPNLSATSQPGMPGVCPDLEGVTEGGKGVEDKN